MTSVLAPAKPPHHLHATCWACGENPHGLQLRFAVRGGCVEADFFCEARYAGYDGIVQGGIVASLLDSAMTNCLFEHGLAAVTAELVVRFRHPVHVGEQAQVRAWIVRSDAPVFRLKAELRQAGVLMAAAHGAFMLPRTHRHEGH